MDEFLFKFETINFLIIVFMLFHESLTRLWIMFSFIKWNGWETFFLFPISCKFLNNSFFKAYPNPTVKWYFVYRKMMRYGTKSCVGGEKYAKYSKIFQFVWRCSINSVSASSDSRGKIRTCSRIRWVQAMFCW